MSFLMHMKDEAYQFEDYLSFKQGHIECNNAEADNEKRMKVI